MQLQFLNSKSCCASYADPSFRCHHLFNCDAYQRDSPKCWGSRDRLWSVEALTLTRCLAAEWSPLGVRVVCISSGGMYDTRTIQQTLEAMGRTAGLSRDAFWEYLKQTYLLKRMSVVDDTAKITAFIASDRANTLTGAIINASCGQILD